MKQFKIRTENKPGALAEVCKALAAHKVNMRSISAEGRDENTGIIKIIPDNDDLARKALNEKGFAFTESDIIVLDVIDNPEKIASMTRKIADAEINIKSFYLLDKGLFAMTVPREEYMKATGALENRVVDTR